MATDQPEITLTAEENPEMDTTGKTNPTQTPDKPESGIVYRKWPNTSQSLFGRRSAKIQPESPHEWLWVTEVEEGLDRDSWEIVFSDHKLRDFIAKVIAKYNGHTGNSIWQASQVTLSSPFKALVFNHAELESEAQSTSLDPTTRGRLQSLLQEVDKIHDPLRWKIPESVDDLSNFRIQYALLWTLFKPGSLVVGAWNLADDLQVFQVHDVSYGSKEKTLKLVSHAINELVITAWMWDWDGKNIVRTMFDLKISEFAGDKPPAELSCYPVAFYEDVEGHRGLEAIRGTSVYRDRRANYLQYALDHHHLGLRRYSGDFYGGIPAFQSDRGKADMGFRGSLWSNARPRVVKVRMTLGPQSFLY
jgi:hypothetical protein